MWEPLRQSIRTLYPGYFALVMATGIVSLACHFLELSWLAWPLFVLNNVQYLVLGMLLLARAGLDGRLLLTDLTSHASGPGFLTIVAATGILGTQYMVLAGSPSIATALWFFAVAQWLVLIYTIFTSVTIREHKPTLEHALSGGWLLFVVSTQSVSVLGTMLAPHFGAQAELALFVTLCLYLLGCMFYLLILTLIFYRFTFLHLAACDFTPPYWINMGAVAITTMAGTRLLQHGTELELLTGMVPFIKGFTLFFWATATWWIPELLILGDWRHVIKRVPLAYHPAYWAMVFPLGMYTAATFQLANALNLPFLLAIPHIFVYVALAAWVIVFVAMLGHIVRHLRPSAAATPEAAPTRYNSEKAAGQSTP